MKRFFLTQFLAMLLVAVITFGIAWWLRCRSCATPRPNLTRALHLTDTQAIAVAGLDANYEKRLREICAAHCAARTELSHSLDNPNQAADCCARMCAAQADSEKAALDHILQIRALLTPEQQQRHAELFRQQWAGACPMRIHQP